MSIPTPEQDLPPAGEVVDLAEVFARHARAPWLVVQPGGNWGDHLIYLGAEKLARDAKLEWTGTDHRAFPTMAVAPGTCIYLHGGGGFNSWGSGRAFDMLARAVSIPGVTVVQGPQTCEVGNPAVAARFSELMRDAKCASLLVLAREPSSWNYMRQHLPAEVPVGLAHDTALALTREDVLATIGLTKPPRGRYDLVISRRDDEMPQSSPDSAPGALFLDPGIYADSFHHWLRIHLFARTIVSNRLHSAIIGAIAGIPTTLLPGSYHKSRSLWEFSLASRGVRWANELPASSKGGFDPFTLLPAFIRRSWKVQRLAYRLKGMPGA